MAPKPLLRSRSHAKMTFGAATGVSDPRLQKIRLRHRCAGGKAASVAGYVGPGFHTWLSGHIPQDHGSETASPYPVHCQKTFGAATGVSDPRLQKIRGARAKSAERTLIGHRRRTSRTSFDPCHAKPPRPLTSPSCLPFNPISSHPMSFHFRPSRHGFLYFISLNHGLIAILF